MFREMQDRCSQLEKENELLRKKNEALSEEIKRLMNEAGEPSVEEMDILETAATVELLETLAQALRKTLGVNAPD